MRGDVLIFWDAISPKGAVLNPQGCKAFDEIDITTSA
jgi:hypothetical protein